MYMSCVQYMETCVSCGQLNQNLYFWGCDNII